MYDSPSALSFINSLAWSSESFDALFLVPPFLKEPFIQPPPSEITPMPKVSDEPKPIKIPPSEEPMEELLPAEIPPEEIPAVEGPPTEVPEENYKVNGK
jgi:hypothetical protein